MAALYAMQVDDLEVELDAAEAPILDGSSKPFVEDRQKPKPASVPSAAAKAAAGCRVRARFAAPSLNAL